MTEQQIRKGHIRRFMQEHYTDERLAMLLAHARDGKLSYKSCCCFVGIAIPSNIGHRLLGSFIEEGISYPPPDDVVLHMTHRDRLCRPNHGADYAYGELFISSPAIRFESADTIRRRILIPIIRAEMRRRERLTLELPAKQERREEVVV